MLLEDGSSELEVDKRRGRRAIGMLNELVWSNNTLAVTEELIYKPIVESVMLYGQKLRQ